MARFSLNIYGENDEVIKTYETDHLRWGVLLKAVELQEELKNIKPAAQFKVISSFLKNLFIDLSDDDLAKADYNDIMNTFNQVLASTGSIKGNQTKN